MGRMPYMDQSGLYAMEDALVNLVKKGKLKARDAKDLLNEL